MAKRKLDLTVEADRQLALQYFDELDSDEFAENSGDDVSVASEDDFVENIDEVDDILHYNDLNEDNNISQDSDSDNETLANLRARYLSNPSYISKNRTVWKQDPPVGRPPRQNTVRVPSGLTDASKQISDVASSFKLFICEAMVDKIVQFTNQKAENIYESWNEKHPDKQKKWTPVDTTEMYAVIGLLITAGAKSQQGTN